MIKIISYDKLESTNRYAFDNIKNFPANTIVRAEIQTAGRGRFQRNWISDKKNNCYISFILKPDLIYRKHFQNLTQYLSVILCDELSKYNVNPNIKWPNDVLINDKKIAGILSEASFSDKILNGIILGVGVNLNLTYENLKSIDIPATSLNIECNKKIDSNEFIQNLANNFFKNYNKFLEEGFPLIKAKYISYCNFIGKTVSIKNPEPMVMGIATNINDDGTLEILTPQNNIEKIISGDIEF